MQHIDHRRRIDDDLDTEQPGEAGHLLSKAEVKQKHSSIRRLTSPSTYSNICSTRLFSSNETANVAIMSRSSSSNSIFSRLFLCLVFCVKLQYQSTDGFTCQPLVSPIVVNGKPRIRRPSLPSVSHSTTASTTLALKATIEFTGESRISIDVPMPKTSNTNKTARLPDWLLSSESDQFFLGTDRVRKRPDGLWDAIQPSVDWFGLDLVPVFVMKLERSESKVSTIITEARSEMKSGRGSSTGHLVSRIMEKSTFRGGNSVVWRETPWRGNGAGTDKNTNHSNGDAWVLTADLSLTLVIPLPRFLPLPPGFNSIGSRIVKATCRKRLESFVIDLQQAYFDWVEGHEH